MGRGILQLWDVHKVLSLTLNKLHIHMHCMWCFIATGEEGVLSTQQRQLQQCLHAAAGLLLPYKAQLFPSL